MKPNFKEFVLYLLFGFLTTIISISSYWLLTRALGLEYYAANIISWVVAVSFAFVTNRGIVFKDFGETGKKALLFFASRIFTLCLETILLIGGIEILKINDFITKVCVQFVVIVTNYLLGKLLVFRKKKK